MKPRNNQNYNNFNGSNRESYSRQANYPRYTPPPPPPPATANRPLNRSRQLENYNYEDYKDESYPPEDNDDYYEDEDNDLEFHTSMISPGKLSNPVTPSNQNVSSSLFSSWSKFRLLVIGVIMIIIIGLVLYFVFRWYKNRSKSSIPDLSQDMDNDLTLHSSSAKMKPDMNVSSNSSHTNNNDISPETNYQQTNSNQIEMLMQRLKQLEDDNRVKDEKLIRIYQTHGALLNKVKQKFGDVRTPPAATSPLAVNNSIASPQSYGEYFGNGTKSTPLNNNQSLNQYKQNSNRASNKYKQDHLTSNSNNGAPMPIDESSMGSRK